MLELQNLTLTVPSENGTTDILKDVSLTIEDKKFLVITGPNGGGKTTLAKVIMGLAQPTSGKIRWNGEDITALNIAERAKKGISYGFQQPPRFKGMKVSDLLQLTDPSVRAKDRVVKKSEKDGFYTALDVGCVWLERALSSK